MSTASSSSASVPTYDYDLVVIGGGPAGEKGAAQAAYFGHKVCLIEEWKELGGACINWGTLASKTLRESALFLSGFRTRQLGEGMHVEFKADVSLSNFMARKNMVQLREQQRARRSMLAPWHNIRVMRGKGRLADPHTIVVKTMEGDVTLTARIILIASGSVPARPPHIPFNDENVFDSTTILEMKRLPKSMAVVGAGVIGSEYACLFNAMGVKTTLIHPKGRALDSLLDAEIGEEFMSRLKAAHMELAMNEQLETATRVDGGVRIKLKSGREFEVEALLYALGRSGNTDGMGLKELGLPIGKYGHIERVDPITYQTPITNIYAAGDVVGPPALASTSMEQGRLAMCHAFRIHYKSKLSSVLPAGIYTIPEISQVGKTEQDCQREGIPYVVGKSRFGEHGRGQIIGDTEGMIKLIVDATNGKLLGAHVIGEIASELVHIGMACLMYEGDLNFFIDAVFNYPTLSDVYKYAAYDALGKLNKVRAEAAKVAEQFRKEAAAAGKA
jgi:NAD(P) transhydrogenase